MTLTRRNVAVVGEANRPTANGTIWEQEATEYWKEMEPAKRHRHLAQLAARVALVLAVTCGVFVIVQLTRTRFATTESPAVTSSLDEVPVEAITAVVTEPLATSSTPSPVASPLTAQPSAAVPSPMKAPAPPVPAIEANPVFANNQAAVDLLRARCRVRGVQTRWHEETCRKLCVRESHNAPCMNGCSYGSITVTKLTCEETPVVAIPTESQCPDGVSCKMACRAYDGERPFPDLRNACERACAAIVPSSCSRILQIQRDLYRSTIQ